MAKRSVSLPYKILGRSKDTHLIHNVWNVLKGSKFAAWRRVRSIVCSINRNRNGNKLLSQWIPVLWAKWNMVASVSGEKKRLKPRQVWTQWRSAAIAWGIIHGAYKGPREQDRS